MSQRKYNNALINENSPFALTESFRTIRTNMQYTGNGEKCPVYAITSSDMEAGKSIFSANISQAFAQLGKKVVLLDCDLRKPVQHKIFGIENLDGMSELLAGLSESFEKLVTNTRIENLDLITAGRIPPNPTELLAGENMEKLLTSLKQKYDVIIIDFPPANVVIDAVVPAEYITSYVIVVRCGRDKSQQIEEIVNIIKQAKSNIAGFVLNDVNPKTSGIGHYRRYYSKYRYRYGSKRYYNHYYSDKPKKK